MRKLTIMMVAAFIFLGTSAMAQSAEGGMTKEEKKERIKGKYETKADAKQGVQKKRRANSQSVNAAKKQKLKENYDSKDEAKQAVQEHKMDNKPDNRSEKKDEVKATAKDKGYNKADVKQQGQKKKKQKQN